MTTDDSKYIASILVRIQLEQEAIEQIDSILSDLNLPKAQRYHCISMSISKDENYDMHINPIITPEEMSAYKTYLIALKSIHVYRLAKLEKIFESITVTF